jgi:co-chaperonin GroES (HSP10)
MGWTTTSIRLTGAHVLVRLDEQATHFGAIEIPDEFRKYPQTGAVIAVGPGPVNLATGRRDPLGVEVGERVVFGKWNGVGLADPDDDYAPGREDRYRLMDQGKQFPDIYGVIEDAPEVVSEYGAPQVRPLRGAP